MRADPGEHGAGQGGHPPGVFGQRVPLRHGGLAGPAQPLRAFSQNRQNDLARAERRDNRNKGRVMPVSEWKGKNLAYLSDDECRTVCDEIARS